MEGGKPERLTARRKFELYLEARKNPDKLGEVLRRFGVHMNDFRRIEATVEAAAVEALKGRGNGRAGLGPVEQAEYEALVRDLSEKDKALAELTVEYTLLKKSDRSGSRVLSTAYRSTGSSARR
jgi:hypothetical protein